MRSGLYCLAFCLASACCSQAWSQNANSRHAYGKGVHAYYRGEDSVARQHLDESIAANGEDPRAYYFRGLAKLRGGDADGANSDFNTAATIEYSGNGNYDVGMSLVRIQGANRVSLERTRRGAHAAMRSAPRSEAIQRMEPPAPQQAPEPYDEFDEAPIGRDRIDELPPLRELPADPADVFGDDPSENGLDDDLFGEPTTADGTGEGGKVVSAVMRALLKSGGKVIPKPGLSLPLPGGAPVEADNPFGDDPIVEDAPLENDLFGDEPMDEQADEAPAVDGLFGDDPPATDDDPFGDDGDTTPVTDDPFGDDLFGDDGDEGPSGGESPAADDDPFGDDGGEAPATEDDPFSDDLFGDDGDEGPSGGESPAADDDPFGDDGGEAPATEDDPFSDDLFGDDGDEGPSGGESPAADDDDPFAP